MTNNKKEFISKDYILKVLQECLDWENLDFNYSLLYNYKFFYWIRDNKISWYYVIVSIEYTKQQLKDKIEEISNLTDKEYKEKYFS